MMVVWQPKRNKPNELANQVTEKRWQEHE